MSKATPAPSEARRFHDPATGAVVRQVTAAPAIHHHPFYYLPAYDDAMQRLVFVSHRTGQPEIFSELREADGQLLQLTVHAGLHEWSVHPSRDGQWVYYTDQSGGWRVQCETQRAEQLFAFDQFGPRSAVRSGAGEPGKVGAAMGTTALSHDDRYWAVPVKAGPGYQLLLVDTDAGAVDVIAEAEMIGHPQFHPHDNTLLRYAGAYHSRMWVVRRDGSEHRLVYQRQPRQWIVHETWNPLPGTRELLTADWPHGVIGVDIDSGKTRWVTRFNAWHPMVSRDGRLMVTDTVFPDTGLHLFDPQAQDAVPRALCQSQASSVGAHWNTDHCPYDDPAYQRGEWKPYAPQHTHPHPNFSPDGRYVVFTSDRTGTAQVYEVDLHSLPTSAH